MKKIFINKYALITLIVFLLIILCFIFETNIINITYKYLTNVDYRDSIMQEMSNFELFNCYFQYIFMVMKNFEWKFDYIIIWSTNIYQLLVPFIAILSSIFYLKHIKDIKSIFGESIKLSISIFIAYIIFYTLVFFVTNGSCSDYISRELFLDILGDEFYNDNTYLYYLLDGMVKFLFIPFVYIFCFHLICSSFKNHEWFYYYIIFYYFGFASISSNLEKVFGDMFIYLNPMSIMVSGSYVSVSTIPLFISNFMIILISIIIYYIVVRSKNEKNFKHKIIFITFYILFILLFCIVYKLDNFNINFLYHNPSFIIIFFYLNSINSSLFISNEKWNIIYLKKIMKNNIGVIFLLTIINLFIIIIFKINFDLLYVINLSIQLLLITSIIDLYKYNFGIEKSNIRYLCLIFFSLLYFFEYIYRENIIFINFYKYYLLEGSELLKVIIHYVLWGLIPIINIFYKYLRDGVKKYVTVKKS